jgi:hypothetical protein
VYGVSLSKYDIAGFYRLLHCHNYLSVTGELASLIALASNPEGRHDTIVIVLM